jgi:hypothetical protein
MVLIPVAAPAPMPVRRRSGVRTLAVVALIGVAGVALWFGTRQSFEAELAEHGVEPATVVVLDDETRVAVRSAAAGSVEAFFFDHDPTRGWDAGVGRGSGGPEIGDGVVISMMGWGGEDTLRWSTLLYGIGPAGTARVDVVAGPAIGRISDPASGAFFIASRHELTPQDIRYRLLGGDGAILFEGHGLGRARAP